MLGTKKRLVYRAFGLTIGSDIHIPELPESSSIAVDVVIEWGNLDGCEVEKNTKINFKVAEDSVIFCVPEIAVFYIERGSRIVISPIDDTKQDQIRLHLLGSCMGALLLQRKIFPLHGSALHIGGKAIAIVGDSGAGKSTLAASFLQRGYQLLSDDVIPIRCNAENVPTVFPTYPYQKLSQVSLHHYEMDTSSYQPIVARENKFSVPVLNQFYTESLPLAFVFVLHITNYGEVKISTINGLKKLEMLFLHTFRNFLIKGSGLLNWHFQASVHIGEQTHFYQLQRPKNGCTIDQLTELILSTIERQENK